MIRPPVVGTGRRGVRRHGSAAVLVILAVVVTTLTGCTSARDTLGTSASSCFEALAIASDAVEDRGTFAGVRLISLTGFGADVHMRAELTERFGPSVHSVCAVAYRGTFTTEQVEKPLGPPPEGGVGHYAIVIVSKPQNHLLGTVVRTTQPLRFGHPL